MTDIVSTIWAAAIARNDNLNTAEGRADFDDYLRAELAKIERESVRRNAAEMIREKRAGLWIIAARRTA